MTETISESNEKQHSFRMNEINSQCVNYLLSESKNPLFICGDSLKVLENMPENSIDCCITSPPYWGKRIYSDGGIGQENTYEEYISSILNITSEIYRVLKPTGSFWLNIGDTYLDKNMLSIPWRIAISMTDKQKWILRNTVIWNKVKGNPDNANDKLRNMYEPVFHFVKSKQYYYDIDKIRNIPKSAVVKNGQILSATGVSGKKYRKQIENSIFLTDVEKENALNDLDRILDEMKNGQIPDFRMVIRGQQRATHSNSEKVSGRAKELSEKGYYFLKYNPKGTKPGDIWEIIPEDTQDRGDDHYAAYPEELCIKPILTTCPKNGTVLDPFCGTGTTMVVAKSIGVKSIGIDISQQYIEKAKVRSNGQ